MILKRSVDIVWDMETNDPDDFLALIFLLGHPGVNLRAITIMPGSPAQVGLVRCAVNGWFGRDIPIGAGNIDCGVRAVSRWHYDTFGDVPPSRAAVPAGELIYGTCNESTTLVTGASLRNLGRAMQHRDFRLGRLVAQGGFAGEGVVPAGMQLAKFRGLVTCPTTNLDGDVAATLRALNSQKIGRRLFVSKNVCHGVYYDKAMHARFALVKDGSLSLKLIWTAMERYLRRRPGGKRFHDPLAACCALDEKIGTWAEVELFRVGHCQGWGSRLCPGSRTWIITAYNAERFFEVLTGL